MLCDNIQMSDERAKNMLQLDEEFKDLPFYKSNKSKSINTVDLYNKLYSKIKNYDSFKDNLEKILKKNPERNKLTESQYYFIAFCYFSALLNLYYKLKSINKNGRRMIDQINISIITLLARLLSKFKYLFYESCENIFVEKGGKIYFKTLNEQSLIYYNQTIISYNDFMTIYYTIISFRNENCAITCKFSKDISDNINNLKTECSSLHNRIFNFMNQYGQSFKNEFVKVKQNSKPINDRPISSNRRNSPSLNNPSTISSPVSSAPASSNRRNSPSSNNPLTISSSLSSLAVRNNL